MSRQYFNFAPLIRAYESPFTLLTFSEAGYDERGKWHDGEEAKTELKGAIIGARESKSFKPEGANLAKDKRLYTLEKLPDALTGAKVQYRNQEYMIESELENAEFTGVYSYYLRWVKSFDTV